MRAIESFAALRDSTIRRAVIMTEGYAEAALGWAIYRRVDTEPFHTLFTRNALGHIYEIVPDSEGFVSASQVGAPRYGKEDASGALQSVLDAGYNLRIDPGHYLLAAPLHYRTSHQRIEGPGTGNINFNEDGPKRNRAVARFIIREDFATNGADAVITFNHPYNGIKGVEIDFVQPVNIPNPTIDYAIRYQPAIRMLAVAPRVENVIINGAWDGIHDNVEPDHATQVGRGHFEQVYVGAANVGFKVITAMGCTIFNDCQVWPWCWNVHGWLDVWDEHTPTAFELGAIDGLQMTNISARTSRVHIRRVEYAKNRSVSKGPMGHIANLMLDGSKAMLDIEAGRISVHGIYSTSDEVEDTTIRISGESRVQLLGFDFWVTRSQGPTIHVEGRARVQIGLATLTYTGNDDRWWTAIQADDRARLTLMFLDFEVTHTHPVGDCIVANDNAQLIANGCSCRELLQEPSGQPMNANGAVFIRIENDGPHSIVGCQSGGLGYALPDEVELADYSVSR